MTEAEKAWGSHVIGIGIRCECEACAVGRLITERDQLRDDLKLAIDQHAIAAMERDRLRRELVRGRTDSAELRAERDKALAELDRIKGASLMTCIWPEDVARGGFRLILGDARVRELHTKASESSLYGLRLGTLSCDDKLVALGWLLDELRRFRT